MNIAPNPLSEAEILEIIQQPWQESAAMARKSPLAASGSRVYCRGLIEFSNICRRNCFYCGLRVQNRRLARYILTREEILAAARAAAEAGCDTIVLQSGEGACEAEWLAEIVRAIRSELNLPVTLSVGERPEPDYALWREAGATRYLIKHETSDASLYARLHPGYALSQRIEAIRILQDLGYEAGSGFMIGLPGQTIQSIARDIVLCSQLHVDMCGAGPFIPQKDTPLAQASGGDAELALAVLAALRIAMPWASLPATTALATVAREDGQKNGLLAGANVLMPSFTPPDAAKSYVIYDSKNRVSVANAARAIEAAGRTHCLHV